MDEYGFQDAIDATYQEFYNDKLKDIEDELIEEGYERERTEDS
jgi:rhamnogalacturonyl hydrolase YesR